ncbi:MAG: hypothetical protein H6546_00785 [Chitinophagales bacterium]|nr:hypothetical protein [Chitinophagales bacterium]
MMMSGRAWDAGSSHRYGFNGKEQENEISGEGNNYDYGFRIYHTQVARFLSIDPLTGSYPWYTPYQYAGNMPIWAIDIDGLEPGVVFGSTAQVIAVNELSSNVNYVAFELTTLEDAIIKLRAHKEIGNNIKVIYIQTHGIAGSVFLGAGPDGKLNTEATPNGSYMTIDDDELNGLDLEYYRLQKESGNTNIAIDSEKEQMILQLIELGSLLDDDGTLILGGCECGANDEYTNDGDLLVIEMSKLINRAVIANADYTSNTISGKFLDTPRTYGPFFRDGWVQSPPRGTATNKDGIKITGIEHTGENLQLNSEGALYEYTD